MFAETESDQGNQSPQPTPLHGKFELDTFARHCASALPPDPEHNIRRVKMQKLALAWDNACHDTLTFQADDLLRTPARADLQPLPPPVGARIVNATIKFEFCDTTEIALAEITPPNHANVTAVKTLKRIAGYLLKFNIAVTISQLFLLMILLLPTTTTAPLDPDDDDDDANTPAETNLELR